MEYVSRVITSIWRCFHGRDIYALLNKNAVNFRESQHLPFITEELGGCHHMLMSCDWNDSFGSLFWFNAFQAADLWHLCTHTYPLVSISPPPSSSYVTSCSWISPLFFMWARESFWYRFLITNRITMTAKGSRVGLASVHVSGLFSLCGSLIAGDNEIISLHNLQPALRLKAIWTLDKCVLNPFMSVNPLCHISHLLKQLVIVGWFTKIHPEAPFSCWTEVICI